FRDIRPASTLIDDSNRRIVQLLGKSACPCHAAYVRTDYNHVVIRKFSYIINEYRTSIQVVHQYIEKTHDLRGVQVKRNHPMGACRSKKVGNKLGGNGFASRRLTVLPGITEVGHNNCDLSSASPLQCINNN